LARASKRDGKPSFVESNSTYTKGPSMQPSWGGCGVF
jgi:hypothetical protein